MSLICITDRAPSTANEVFTAAAQDATVASPVSFYQIPSSIVRDRDIRSMIESVWTSVDFQKMWFPEGPKPPLPMK
jgi:hypothetical protein